MKAERPESDRADPTAWLHHPVALAVLIGFLRAGRLLDHASSVLLLGTFILTIQPLSLLAMGCAGLALLLAMMEKCYAWRVALDADFFAILSRCSDDAQQFDRSLATFLGRSTAVASRSMESRWGGAKRLLLYQLVFLVMQTTAVFALAFVVTWARLG
jgi:hypothetical protein